MVGGTSSRPSDPQAPCKFEVTRRSAPRHAEGAQLVLERSDRLDDVFCRHNGTGVVRDIDVQLVESVIDT